MSVFLDASALIAIIADEDDADALAGRLEGERTLLCSAVSVWETVTGLCRSYHLPVEAAQDLVRRYLDAARVEMVAIGHQEADLATGAYGRYGKGRHPAAVNMGDCFAYACAKAHDARLLFKGNDFIKTDLISAA